jgi:NACHT domain
MIKERIVELRRDGNRFILASEPADQEADVFDEEWYRDYITNHCSQEVHEVDISGARTTRPIFISNDDESVAFCLMDSDEGASNFELRPNFVNFIDQHLNKYSASETFYEPYKLLVRSQILPSPLYRIRASLDSPLLEGERVSSDEMLNSHYSIILGAPGIGKTTFLRHLAHQLHERNLDLESPQTPILISLRHFDYDEFNHESLQHYLRKRESDEIADLINDKLEAGLFRFLLDGLDEVQSDRRAKIYQGIQEFSLSYPKNSYTITARDSVFDHIPDHADIFRLGDWDDFLIRRWCYENLRDQRVWKDFYADVIQNTDDKRVFRNPLMLNLAAYLFEQYDMLPHRRVDLFFNVVNAIIDEWDKARGIRRSVGLWKSPRHKLNILAHIAYRQFVSGTETVSEDVVQQWIGERTSELLPQMCRALAVETGLLAEVRSGEWTFVHKSIQEYLAAVFVADSSLRPFELLNIADLEQRNRIISYLSNMVSNNTQFVEQVLDDQKIPELEKGNILTTSLSEGMELDNRLKGRVYETVAIYLKSEFEVSVTFELNEKRLSLTAGNVETAKTIRNVLYLVARLGRTKFGEEFRDIAKAVLPKPIYTLIDFILSSSAFFITKDAKPGVIEGRSETGIDFVEK